MHPIDLVLLFAATALALASRAAMKRYVSRRAGKVEAELLEIDVWRLSKGEPFERLLLAVELLSWAACISLIVSLALAP